MKVLFLAQIRPDWWRKTTRRLHWRRVSIHYINMVRSEGGTLWFDHAACEGKAAKVVRLADALLAALAEREGGG